MTAFLKLPAPYCGTGFANRCKTGAVSAQLWLNYFRLVKFFSRNALALPLLHLLLPLLLSLMLNQLNVKYAWTAHETRYSDLVVTAFVAKNVH